MKKLKLIAFLSALALTASLARAQDSGALLDLLVKKKVITDQEAENTRAELAKEDAASSAGKLSLSTPVQQIRLYGDARLRYDYRQATSQGANTQGTVGDSANSDRLRYRLRLGADVTLTDDWFFGFRLETSNDGRSTNVTESQAGTSSSGLAGQVAPFGKAGTATTTVVTGITETTSKIISGTKTTTVVTGFKPTTATAVTSVNFGSTVFVGQVYLRYKPTSWLTVEGGKIPNPFISTPMVWDPDINPEGFAEQLKYTFGPWGGSPAVADGGKGGDGKDNKQVITSAEPQGVTVDLFANIGEFIYDTAAPENQLGTSAGKADTWQFGGQVGSRVNFNQSTYVQVAPTLYGYTGAQNNDFSNVYSGDPGGNQTGINDLLIFDVPAEFDFKLRNIPVTVFGDFAYNIEGPERAAASDIELEELADAGSPLLNNNGTPFAAHPGHNDDIAWQAGVRFGQLKKKGDWTLSAYYQYSGAYALDPNLVDNDIFDSHLNLEGVIFQAGYAFTDAVTFTLQYNYGHIIDKALGTGGSDGTFDGATANPAYSNYNLIQADLNVKF